MRSGADAEAGMTPDSSQIPCVRQAGGHHLAWFL
jgi:hypothetical protein